MGQQVDLSCFSGLKEHPGGLPKADSLHTCFVVGVLLAGVRDACDPVFRVVAVVGEDLAGEG